MTSVPLRTIAGLHESVIDYANRVHDLRSPSDVLNELHDITKKVSGLAPVWWRGEDFRSRYLI
jgi:hypothetical protein